MCTCSTVRDDVRRAYAMRHRMVIRWWQWPGPRAPLSGKMILDVACGVYLTARAFDHDRREVPGLGRVTVI